MISVPGPSTVLLLATGLAGLLGYGWRRKQQQTVEDSVKGRIPGGNRQESPLPMRMV
jgi:hypothetical protein